MRDRRFCCICMLYFACCCLSVVYFVNFHVLFQLLQGYHDKDSFIACQGKLVYAKTTWWSKYCIFNISIPECSPCLTCLIWLSFKITFLTLHLHKYLIVVRNIVINGTCLWGGAVTRVLPDITAQGEGDKKNGAVTKLVLGPYAPMQSFSHTNYWSRPQFFAHYYYL